MFAPVLENLFEYVLRPYISEIEITPLHEALKDTYTSADNRPLPDGSKYLVGYSKIHNKVLITTESLNFEKLKVIDEFGKTLNLELIIETSNTKIFQFTPELNSIFNLKFDNQSIDTILYNDRWKNNVYFIEQ
jgi:hypothetical protein